MNLYSQKCFNLVYFPAFHLVVKVTDTCSFKIILIMFLQEFNVAKTCTQSTSLTQLELTDISKESFNLISFPLQINSPLESLQIIILFESYFFNFPPFLCCVYVCWGDGSEVRMEYLVHFMFTA